MILTEEPLPADGRSMILELDGLDRSGFTFRYPVDKVGRPSIGTSTAFDLRGLRTRMEHVRGLFLGVDGWLDHVSSCAGDAWSNAGVPTEEDLT